MLTKLIRHRALLSYCFEALLDLAISKSLILWTPAHRYTKHYGLMHCETLQTTMPLKQTDISRIRQALRIVPRYLPWHSKCLDQAMAAQRMLNRRGLSNTLYFGVMRDQKNDLLAHAWIRCGDQWIVGYDPRQTYTTVATYASFKQQHPFVSQR
jgi:hypothetical protein